MGVKKRRNGQVFIIGTVIFSGLFLLATAPSGPMITDSSGNSDFREFFQQSLKESVGAFNDELSEEKSIDNAKRGLYSYDRFMLESSASKGINFESYQLAVLPDEGEAVFINYRDTSLEANLYVGGSWTNTTVEPREYMKESFSEGSTTVMLELPGLNNDHRFTAHSPMLVYWMKMDAEGESWQNSVIG